MDMSGLTARQRANVAALEVKKAAVARRYGNAVQIITTPEEAANAPGWMALPLGELNTSKQVTLRMTKEAVDTNKATRLSYVDRDSYTTDDSSVDVVEELERAAGIASTKNRSEVSAVKQSIKPLPARRVKSSVAMSDSEFIDNLMKSC